MSDEQPPGADPADQTGGPATGRPRRALIPIAVLTALGAIAVWAATRMTWTDYVTEDGLTTPVSGSIDGGAWQPQLTPLALVMVAAIAAMFAVRGRAGRVVGAVVALTGIAVVVPAADALIGGVDTDRVRSVLDVPARTEVVSTSAAAGPAVLALLGGLAAVVAGIGLLAGRAERAGLSGAYQVPAARREQAAEAVGETDSAVTDQRLMWDALDGGIDPTDDGADPHDPASGEPGHDR